MRRQQSPVFWCRFLIKENQGETNMADQNNNPAVGSASEGGLLDTSRPDGLGTPSDDQPVLPSKQPVRTPPDVTKRKK
jgi:hypothetical protein